MPDTDPTRPRGVRQLHIPVRDLDRATGFYRDVLGLEHLFTAPPGMAFFDCGPVRLMLAADEEPGEAGGGSIVYYDVADIAAAASALRDRGAEVGQPHVVHRSEGVEVWLADLRDSEGNRAALMSEVEADA